MGMPINLLADEFDRRLQAARLRIEYNLLYKPACKLMSVAGEAVKLNNVNGPQTPEQGDHSLFGAASWVVPRFIRYALARLFTEENSQAVPRSHD